MCVINLFMWHYETTSVARESSLNCYRYNLVIVNSKLKGSFGTGD